MVYKIMKTINRGKNNEGKNGNVEGLGLIY